MKQDDVISKIWILANEIVSLRSHGGGHVGHFYTKYSDPKNAKDVVVEAAKEVGASEDMQRKLSSTAGIFDSPEDFSQIVEVFRTLKVWRDEAKQKQKQNLSHRK